MNGLRDTPSTTMTTRLPAPSELTLAGCLVLLAIFTAVFEGGRDVSGEDAPSAWWHWLLVVAPAVPVAFRRTAPLVATPITVVAQIAIWGSGLATPFFAPLIMIYTVCAEAGARGRTMGIAAGIALSTMTFIGIFAAPDVTIDLLLFTTLAAGVAYMLGIQTAQRNESEIAMAQELAVTQAERDGARELAAANERQRIARELHDIVGHSLSIIAVRAEAADRVAPKNPDAAVDAVGAIASTARSSLADVRRVLAGLSEDDATLELAPVPSLGSLTGLVASFRDAGMHVSLEGSLPEDATIGAAVGAGSYRIVQEALTNVLKHGGPDAVATVHVETHANELRIQIDDTGRGAASQPSTDGRGLAGMQERAEVLGGSLSSGARPGGGYRVSADLPLIGSEPA